LPRDPRDGTLQHPHTGLCGRCRHRRTVTSGKGSSFLLCRRSEDDDRYPRYPRLPMLACVGFEDETKDPR
jgi:hypothetical protein